MPRGQWVRDENTWRALIGEDVGPPPPPKVADPPFVYAVSAFKNAGTTIHSAVPWPTGYQANDVSFIFCEHANDNPTLFTAAGFTEATGSPFGTGTASSSTATGLRIWWKRAVSDTSESSPSVYASTGVDHFSYFMVTVRGCVETGNPWDVVPNFTTLGTASTAVSIGGTTTVTANCLILAIIANAIDTATAQFSGAANASLTSLTTVANANGTANNGGGLAIISGIKATVGATGTTTGTLATSSLQAKALFALRPSAVAGGGVVGMPFGLFNLYRTDTGIQTVGTGSFDFAHDSCNPSNIIAKINSARALGIKLILMPTNGSHSLNWAPGTTNRFDYPTWETRLEQYDDPTIIAAVIAAVADGTLFGFDLIDEPQNYTWNDGVDSGAIMTKALIDTMCTRARLLFGNTVPMGLSVKPEWKTTTHFTAVDFVSYQYSYSKGSLSAWLSNALTQATADKVKIVFSINIVNGGTVNGTNMTPAQVEESATTLATSDSTRVVAQEMWRYDLAIFSRSDIQAALANVKSVLAATSTPATWFKFP
jgi:hypothetical protein